MAAPRSDNVKEIILAKTSELMEETGLSSISLASIAEACGISKGTLYYHYKTKEDIFFDLIERHFREQEQESGVIWDQVKIFHIPRSLYHVSIKIILKFFNAVNIDAGRTAIHEKLLFVLHSVTPEQLHRVIRVDTPFHKRDLLI